MAVLSGRKSLKSIGRFVASHKTTLQSLYELNHGVPSYGTIWNILKRANFESLNNALLNWANHHYPFVENSCVSADGKALRSTVDNAHDETQNHSFLVSIFGLDSNIVYYSSKNEMSKDNEAARVRELFDLIQVNLGISAEEMQGGKVRLDALHCQKKRLLIPKTD